jgi:sugar phosphate isomerase/epimerase
VKKGFIVRPDADMADYAAFARKEGLDGIELIYWEPQVEDFADVRERKQILDDHGIELAAVGVWRIGLADPPAAGTADAIRAGMDFAAELGASCFFTGAGDPEEDDPAGALAACYDGWRERAAARSMDLAVYLGHKGSYIFSEQALAEAVARVPQIGLKLDPVGFIRNLKAEPLYILSKYGGNLTYFHVKGLLRVADRELEPPPGFDALPWAQMFGILHEYGYDGWVTSEPHGRFWSQTPEQRKKYVKLTFQGLAPYLL